MRTSTRLADGNTIQYGLGWALTEYRREKVVEHSGSTGTHIVSIPGKRLTVVLLTNLDAPSVWDPGGLAGRIAAHVIDAQSAQRRVGPLWRFPCLALREKDS